MTIPDYQSLMLPVLRLASDGAPHRLSVAIEELATQLNLTPDERAELLPSGRQSAFGNRVGWARTYLSKAMLLDNSQRGVFLITDRGRQILAENPDRVDSKFLRRFDEFKEFVGAARDPRAPEPVVVGDRTPEEQLDASYEELRRTLAQELLERIKLNSPGYFERLVVDVLVAMGYGGSRPDAGKAIGRSGDGGIDGVINEDVLGLDKVYIQAKRWSDTVHRPTVQEFVGSLEGRRARKGVLITTSGFSAGAHDYVRMIDKNVVLIDGLRLAELMIDHGVGVTDERAYFIKKVDIDYFEE